MRFGDVYEYQNNDDLFESLTDLGKEILVGRSGRYLHIFKKNPVTNVNWLYVYYVAVILDTACSLDCSAISFGNLVYYLGD